MTYRGHVKNGQILLDEPVHLPEGAQVAVQLMEQVEGVRENLNEVLLRHAGRGCDLPADLAAEHDHYAHGKPKR